MGLDISKITNVELKAIACGIDENNNGILDGIEISVFMEKGSKHKDFGQTMVELLEPTPATITVPVESAKAPEVRTFNKDEIKLESSKLNDSEKKVFKGKLAEATSIENVETVLAQLSGYEEAKKVVGEFVKDIKAMKIDSKDDVDKIVKLIDKKYNNCDGFEKDLAKLLAKIAEKEQMKKETDKLIALYEQVKGDYLKANDNKINFTKCLNNTEALMADRDYTGSYYKKRNNTQRALYGKNAYDNLVAYVRKDADAHLDKNDRNVNGETGKTKADTKNGVRDELKDKYKNDKVMKKVIDNDKVDNELEARHNKSRYTDEVLTKVTDTMLSEELKESTKAVLVQYLDTLEKNEDGSYDLTELKEEIKKIISTADLNMNHSDNTEIAELTGVKKLLEDLTNIKANNISKSVVEDLLDFLGLNHEDKRDRSLKTAVNNGLKGVLPGLAAAGIHAVRVNANQDVELLMDATIADDMMSQLGNLATKEVLTDSEVKVTINQSVKIDQTLISMLAGMGEGFLTNLLATLIIGDSKDFEEACVSQSLISNILAKNDDFEAVKNEIQKAYPGTKGAILVALAQKAYDKDNANWKSKFNGFVSEIGGVISNINCEELQGVKFLGKTEQPETVKIRSGKEDATNPEYKADNSDVIDARSSSWEKLVEQYECLDEIKIPADKTYCLKRKSALPVRMLKVAQAITDGNYSTTRLLELAELTFASPNGKYENLKNYEGIDHAKLVEVMGAQVLNKVKMPKVLGDNCNRIVKDIKADIADKSGKGEGATPAEGKILINAGKNGRFGLRVGNEKIIECNSLDELNRKIIEKEDELRKNGITPDRKQMGTWAELEQTI